MFKFSDKILSFKESGRIPIIAEVKSSSPTKGDLLRNRSVPEIVKKYEQAGAACISVVTGKWFGGSLEMLEEASKATDLPILHKDFIRTKSQIDSSKAKGASAVLLTGRILHKSHIEELVNHCLDLTMVPFIEIDRQTHLSKMTVHNDAIVAINNKDIGLKESDEGSYYYGLEMINRAKNCGAALCVSASGIANENEAKSLFHAGYDALLVGTAFLASADIGATVNLFSIP